MGEVLARSQKSKGIHVSEAGHDRKKVAEWNIAGGTRHQLTWDPAAIKQALALTVKGERATEGIFCFNYIETVTHKKL